MKGKLYAALFVLMAFMVPPMAMAADTPQYSSAKDIVTAMTAKAQTIKDYALSFYYTGDPGSYVFNYRCVRPGDIRTQILQGKSARTVLLYLPNEKPDQLKCKRGIARKWMSIKELKLENTPLVESLLDSFLKELQAYPEGTMKGTDRLTLSIGKDVAVSSEKSTITMTRASVVPTPDPSPAAESTPAPTPAPETSPTPSPAPTPSASPSSSPAPESVPVSDSSPAPDDTKKIDRDCYIVEFNNNGTSDLLAIDRETLWVVYRKKVINGRLDQEAVVWDIQENTSPKIDF